MRREDMRREDMRREDMRREDMRREDSGGMLGVRDYNEIQFWQSATASLCCLKLWFKLFNFLS